jgi:ribosomal protein S4E
MIPKPWSKPMSTISTAKFKDGAKCKVIGGVHEGKAGTVRDIHTSRTGHVTITVVQPNGDRFKTLAKNVTITG